jgi:hypothetical protein
MFHDFLLEAHSKSTEGLNDTASTSIFAGGLQQKSLRTHHECLIFCWRPPAKIMTDAAQTWNLESSTYSEKNS